MLFRSTAIGFIVAFGLALIVNYPTTKAQGAKIKQYGGPAINMVMTIIAIGVLVGVMNGTGMIEGMTNAILGILPESLGKHLCFLVALATSIVIPCALAANVTLIGASPYLALGLADITMGEHLKYSFKWIWLLGIACTLFGAVIGKIPV